MIRKIAGLLSFAAATAFAVLWIILILAARPDTFDSFDTFSDSFLFSISPGSSRTWIYIFLMISIFNCIATSVFLVSGRNTKWILVLIALHSATAYVIYSWGFALLLAIPLLFSSRLLDEQ